MVLVSLLLLHLSDQRLVHLTDQVVVSMMENFDFDEFFSVGEGYGYGGCEVDFDKVSSGGGQLSFVENFDEIYSVVHVPLLLLHFSVQGLVHLTVQVLLPLTGHVFLHLSDQGLVHLTARCYFPSRLEENFALMEELSMISSRETYIMFSLFMLEMALWPFKRPFS